MAHAITIRENGKAEMAFTGNRNAIWHGLGNELTADAPLSLWKTEAGMDWEAFESAITFNSMGTDIVFPDKKALFRSDTKAPLGIVGADYKIVQPGEVLEFFDDLTKVNGMKLSTAGTLFGGRRFWALADTGKKFDAVNGDEVGGFLLLVTSVDGTLSTQGTFTSTRVVCQNTLNVALNGAKNAVKVTHKKQFDPREVKMDLGLIDSGWEKFMEDTKRFAQFKMDEKATRKFYEGLFFDASKPADQQNLNSTRTVESLMTRAFAGIGSDLSAGTAWGALNGATELWTHWTPGKMDASRQFSESYTGGMSDKKTFVFDELNKLVAA